MRWWERERGQRAAERKSGQHTLQSHTSYISPCPVCPLEELLTTQWRLRIKRSSSTAKNTLLISCLISLSMVFCSACCDYGSVSAEVMHLFLVHTYIHMHIQYTACESQAVPVCVVIRVMLLLHTGSVCNSSRAKCLQSIPQCLRITRPMCVWQLYLSPSLLHSYHQHHLHTHTPEV